MQSAPASAGRYINKRTTTVATCWKTSRSFKKPRKARRCMRKQSHAARKASLKTTPKRSVTRCLLDHSTSYQSEHPDYMPADGAAFVSSKIDAIAANPDVWAKTAFILNYDENDGIFDHVAPPVPPAGTPHEFVNGLPIGGGVPRALHHHFAVDHRRMGVQSTLRSQLGAPVSGAIHRRPGAEHQRLAAQHFWRSDGRIPNSAGEHQSSLLPDVRGPLIQARYEAAHLPNRFFLTPINCRRNRSPVHASVCRLPNILAGQLPRPRDLLKEYGRTLMILVTGATGKNGAEIIRRLSGRKELVRAMVHRRSNILRGTPSVELEYVEADFDDPASLRKVLSGVQRAFLVTNSSERVEEQQLRFVDLAREAGVKHIVYLSQLHASSDSPLRFLRYHAAVEEALRRSGMSYTNLRPNLYMQGLLMIGRTIASEGRFFAPAGDARVSVVDVRDIAAVAVVR